MKKFDFFKISKIVVAVVLAIVVVGAVLTATLGFNKGIELSKGYEIKVEVDANFGDNQQKIEKAVENTFDAEKVDYKIEKVLDEGNILIYQFKEDITEENTKAFDELAVKVQTAVNKALESSTVEATVTAMEREGIFGSSSIWWTLLAFGVAMVLAFIYLLIRYNWLHSLLSVALSIIEVILLLSLVGLVRIPVAPSFIVVSLTGVILSLVNSVILINGAKEKAKLDKKAPVEESINDLLNGALVRNCALFIGLVLTAVVLLVIGGTFTSLALQIIGLAVATLIVNQFVFAPCFVLVEKMKNGSK
ncbi:MAG: hypothetical protein E7342_00500 [Clostridiales bacterium]|nr:hypothetical protein [Clostridiales bacterium]